MTFKFRTGVILVFGLSTFFSMPVNAALYQVSITGQVSANQTNNGLCGIQGFNVCHYFPMNDVINLSFVYDDASPLSYVQNGSSAYYDNAIKSISFSSAAVGYHGTYTGDFGQFIVRDAVKDGLTFRVWEQGQNVFAYATANAVDLDTLQTEVAFPADDAYGDIQISSIKVNLTSLSNSLFNSFDLPTSFNLSDFDDPVNTNWGFGVKSASGFGGSVGVSITDVNVQAVSAVPVPAAIWLFFSGLLSLVGLARRKY